MKYPTIALLCLITLSSLRCTEQPHSTTMPERGFLRGWIHNAIGFKDYPVTVTLNPGNHQVVLASTSEYNFDFLAPGFYSIQAQGEKLTSRTTVVYVKEDAITTYNIDLIAGKKNLPPNAPTTLTPLLRVDSITPTHPLVLQWQCSDPEYEPLFYDLVYSFDDKFRAMDTIIAETRTPDYSLTLPILSATGTLYWRVIAHDANGNSTISPRWEVRMPPVATDLLVWLPFDGTLENKSGYPHSLANYNTEYGRDQHDRDNHALTTDAQNISHTSISFNPASTALKRESFSLSFWMKCNNPISTPSRLVGTYFHPLHNATPTGWLVGLSELGQLTVNFGWTARIINSPQHLDNGAWHHIVVVVQRMEATADLYVDNKKIASLMEPHIRDFQDGEQAMVIGNMTTQNTWRVNHILFDDLRLFRGTISEADIATLFAE